MAKLENYKGGVPLTGGLETKGGATFPLMEAHDIVVDENGTRLDEKLAVIQGTEVALNIKDGVTEGSLQQVPDILASGMLVDEQVVKLDFSGKNEAAINHDSSLDGLQAYGGEGKYASAFGGKSVAQGKRALAQGTTTIAKGNYSHAEGDCSVAYGDGSHAEGLKTFAEGGYTHTEGHGAIARKNASHAEGCATEANEDYSHAEGHASQANGYGSHAEGLNTLTKGAYSHAEGSHSQALGDGAHAEGEATTAYGKTSHAEGGSKGIAQNLITLPGGKASVEKAWKELPDEGKVSLAYGEQSHVEGSSCVATDTAAHAEGDRSTAFGAAAHAEGDRSTATKAGAHAEGSLTTAYGTYSHAEGESANKAVLPDQVEGQGRYDQIYETWKNGRFTIAYEIGAHAEGGSTIAFGRDSHAEGRYTRTKGIGSHAEGRETFASGEYSHAEGKGTRAVGNQSHAGGYNTTAGHDNQTVIGQFNKNKSGTLLEVGNGEDGAPSNAFEVHKDGSVKAFKKPEAPEDVARLEDLTDAIGGVSAASTPVTIRDVWEFTEAIGNLKFSKLEAYNISFVCNSTRYTKITTDSGVLYYDSTAVYNSYTNVWVDPLYKVISFDGIQLVSNAFYQNFTAMAKKLYCLDRFVKISDVGGKLIEFVGRDSSLVPDIGTYNITIKSGAGQITLYKPVMEGSIEARAVEFMVVIGKVSTVGSDRTIQYRGGTYEDIKKGTLKIDSNGSVLINGSVDIEVPNAGDIIYYKIERIA